jgi:hypothetical protein
MTEGGEPRALDTGHRRAAGPDRSGPDGVAGAAALHVRAADPAVESGDRLGGRPGRPCRWLPAQIVGHDGAAWSGGRPVSCAGLALWTGVVVVLFVQIFPQAKRRQIKRRWMPMRRRCATRRRGTTERPQRGSGQANSPLSKASRKTSQSSETRSKGSGAEGLCPAVVGGRADRRWSAGEACMLPAGTGSRRQSVRAGAPAGRVP